MEFLDEPDEQAEVDMGSMIDCVFLLLLYFMCSAQIIPEEISRAYDAGRHVDDF